MEQNKNEALSAKEKYQTAVESASDYIEHFDLLETITNVGNDEVFTPRKTCNMLLDILPEEVWHNPNYKWLNPATKNGIFEREIALRLDEGLKDVIPDEETRRKHILQNMIYSIGQTKFTSNVARRTLYYCSQANRKCDGIKAKDGHYINGYAIGNGTWFNTAEGNIYTPKIEHEYEGKGKNRKCKFCGISENSKYNDALQREHYAYEFIHYKSHHLQYEFRKMFFKGDANMKFDIIIGNPPYQLSDGGGGQGTSSIPIYHKFINQALELKPKYICMIIPARWMVKGKGSELIDFKNKILAEKRIPIFHQYINSTDCFPNNDIPGGVCYFLLDKDYEGKCKFTVHNSDKTTCASERFLQESNLDIVVRDKVQLSIINKVIDFAKNEKLNFVSEIISPRCPFNLEGDLFKKEEKYKMLPNFSEIKFDNSFLIYGTDSSSKRTQRYISNTYVFKKGLNLVNKYKIFVGKASVGGQTLGEAKKILLLPQPTKGLPNEVCTDSYEVIGPFDTEKERDFFIKYMETKTFRFLLGCRASSQNLSRDSYRYIPHLNMTNAYDDKKLYKLFGFNEEEIIYIENHIGDVNWKY